MWWRLSASRLACVPSWGRERASHPLSVQPVLPSLRSLGGWMGLLIFGSRETLLSRCEVFFFFFLIAPVILGLTL